MFILLVVSLFFSSASSESVHWQWRELACKTTDPKSPEAASCQIELREKEDDVTPRTAPELPCHEETVNGKVRTYCNVLCPGADTVYLIKRTPSNHRSCFGQISYKIEKKDKEFYLWREGRCRSSDVGFRIRCEFAFGRKDFMSDEQLFRAARKV